MSSANQPLVIAGRMFRSRLILGTGKFSSPEAMRDALAASGAEMVTVALRRADLSGQRDPFANILEFIDPKKYLLLPNTSGAMNADEAVRLARLAAAAGLPKWVKLEIHPDPRYLLPDPVETFKAAEILVKEGFTVLPYINADPVLAKRLQDVGVATVMPLGSPIGSNRGIQTRDQIRIIIEQATVPVVVDAGLGAPSHAAEAMEMGADAVLVNTAVAVSSDPNRMAVAFKMAVEAGRAAFEAGLGGHAGNRQRDEPVDGIFGLNLSHKFTQMKHRYKQNGHGDRSIQSSWNPGDQLCEYPRILWIKCVFIRVQSVFHLWLNNMSTKILSGFARAANPDGRDKNPRAGSRRRDAGPIHLGRRVAHFARSAGAGGGF